MDPTNVKSKIEIATGQWYRRTGRNPGVVEIVRITRSHSTGLKMAFCRMYDTDGRLNQSYEQPVGEIRHLVEQGRLIEER